MSVSPISAGPSRDVFVLSGGGARGAAQVGMLDVLLRHGVRPSALVGCSVGALNAAAIGCAAGVEQVELLARQWRSISKRDVFETVSGGGRRVESMMRSRSVFSNTYLSSMIGSCVPCGRLEDLPTPVRVVTTLLSSRRPVYHDSGDLRSVLLASSALPALFPPISLPSITGRTGLHIDGGFSDLVPLTAAVDLSPTRVFVLDVTPVLPRGSRRRSLEEFASGLGMAMRVREHVDFGRRVEVYPIRVDTRGVKITDFSHTAELIAAGAQAAVAALVAGPVVEASGRVARAV